MFYSADPAWCERGPSPVLTTGPAPVLLCKQPSRGDFQRDPVRKHAGASGEQGRAGTRRAGQGGDQASRAGRGPGEQGRAGTRRAGEGGHQASRGGRAPGRHFPQTRLPLFCSSREGEKAQRRIQIGSPREGGADINSEKTDNVIWNQTFQKQVEPRAPAGKCFLTA